MTQTITTALRAGAAFGMKVAEHLRRPLFNRPQDACGEFGPVIHTVHGVPTERRGVAILGYN